MASIYTRSYGGDSGLLTQTNGLRVFFGSNQNSDWHTIATFNSSTTGFYIYAVSGHNSNINTYENTATSYTYNVAANSVRTLWTGSGIGGTKGRIVVNPSPSDSANYTMILQAQPTSTYATMLLLNVLTFSGSIVLFNSPRTTDYQGG